MHRQPDTERRHRCRRGASRMRGMNRRRARRFLLAALSACVLALAAGAALAETLTLRVHTFNSPKAIAVSEFLEPWAEEVEAKSDGRVAVQVFPAMQLGGRPADLYGQARDGVVDAVWTIPGYSPGRFPLTEVFELPYVCGDAQATSQALTEFHRKWMQDEYADTHPLVFHATAPGHLHTASHPVRSLADLGGLKVRAASQTAAAVIESLGAIPVGMPVPQVYEAVARGVVDGALLPWTIMRPFRLHEVTSHHTEISMGCTSFVLTMNKVRYEGLPEDVQQILTSTTGMALAKRLGRLWQADELRGRELAVEREHAILSLEDTEHTLWRAATEPVIDRWVAKVSQLGHDGQALLADAKRLVADYTAARGQ